MVASQRLWLSILLLLSQSIDLAIAHIESCAGACDLALGDVSFTDVNASLGYYPDRCGSRLRASSVYLCMRTYCRPREISSGWTRLNHDCERFGNITLPPLSIIDDFSDKDVAHLRRLDINETTLQTTVPVLPSSSLFNLAFRTKNAWNASVDTRHVYGNAMFWFWSIVIAFGITKRFVEIPAQVRIPYVDEKRPASAATFLTRLHWFVQAYISIPAFFSRNCAQPLGWCTIPPRLQSSLLVIFAAINVVLCCISYDVFQGNLYWTPFVQWMRYVGDRTGIIATANLPIIWLFATRNNIVLYVTGWSFDTAMQFHRWVARISTVEAVIHSLAYSLLVIGGNSWADFWDEWTFRYWNMGALATVVMCGLCAASLWPVRHYRYELFLLIHISLGILTLIGMWYHLEIFNGDYNYYLWPCVVIWLADRCARLTRLAYLSFPLQLSSLSYNQAANTLWLEIPSSLSHRPKPGEYYFLYLLHDRTFYQSHPFTMSSWVQTSHSGGLRLNFLIRPYDGFTGRIADLAQQTASNSRREGFPRQVRVLIEGPYGTSHDFRKHDSLVFIVGGTGAAIALAYLDDISKCVNGRQTGYCARHIRVVWAVQTLAMFEQVFDVELKPKLDKLTASDVLLPFTFELDIYITRHHVGPSAKGTVSPPTTPRTPGQLSQEQHRLPPEERRTDEIPNDDDPSEHSPLLSPSSSPCATPRPQSPQNFPSPKTSYTLPHNVHLTIHRTQRPDIPFLLHETCHWHPSGIGTVPAASSFAEPPCRWTQAADESNHSPSSTSFTNGSSCETNSRATPATGTTQHPKSSSTRPRIAVVSCGPASLSDEVRASLVETLRRGSMDDMAEVDFWSESYSW